MPITPMLTLVSTNHPDNTIEYGLVHVIQLTNTVLVALCEDLNDHEWEPPKLRVFAQDDVCKLLNLHDDRWYVPAEPKTLMLDSWQEVLKSSAVQGEWGKVCLNSEYEPWLSVLYAGHFEKVVAVLWSYKDEHLTDKFGQLSDSYVEKSYKHVQHVVDKVWLGKLVCSGDPYDDPITGMMRWDVIEAPKRNKAPTKKQAKRPTKKPATKKASGSSRKAAS